MKRTYLKNNLNSRDPSIAFINVGRDIGHSKRNKPIDEPPYANNFNFTVDLSNCCIKFGIYGTRHSANHVTAKSKRLLNGPLSLLHTTHLSIGELLPSESRALTCAGLPRREPVKAEILCGSGRVYEVTGPTNERTVAKISRYVRLKRRA